MADKPTLDEIDALFKNEYFQEKLRRRLLRTPYNVVASVGALVGIGGLAAAIVFFNNKVTGLKNTVDQGQAKIAELRRETDAAKESLKEDFSHAKEDLDKEVRSVKEQGVGLGSSAAVVTGAMKLAADSINGAQSSLRDQQRSLVHGFEELDNKQAKNQTAEDKIEERQREIISMQTAIQQKNELLTKATENADRAMMSAQQLQQNVQELSSFKTFEMVTLRSHAQKRIALKNIQTAGSAPVDYTLEFQSHGLRKPVEIVVTVRLDGVAGERVLTYPEVAPTDPVRDRWPSFCICGTPWMFQGENWLQSLFVRDFLTMRIVGMQGSCELPRGYSREECAAVPSRK